MTEAAIRQRIADGVDAIRARDLDTLTALYAPGTCNACPPSAVTSVRYRWQGDHVSMLDPPPPG
ncbi:MULTISPECIES: hypothetical protein [unclassified Mycolicibacterium]|uniref:hypothetical protein n=1 Tax=unclassified Mycolicibacterium TaxID=2636767 RepID=UPI00192E39F3|nr:MULTISPECIES: hypothetical protein [unclassified Mycolicibacterium]